MRISLIKYVALIISFLFIDNIRAQVIPFENTHLTLSSYDQVQIDKSLITKNLTMDIVMDRLSPITNNNKAAKMGFYVSTTEWIQAPYDFSAVRYDTYIPIPKPGIYKGKFGFGLAISEIKVAFRGDPIVSGSNFEGFISDIATKEGDKWIITSEDNVTLKVYVWFDGQFNKGKNDLYDSSGQLIASNKLSYSLKSGEYKLILDDRFSEPQTINIEIKTAPKINKQPQSVTLVEGENISLQLEATGGDLSFQWYKNNSLISGATSATFSKTNITIEDAGKYKCEVKNPRGTVFSNEVDLNVTFKKPVIITQPGNKTLNEQESLALTISAEGKGLSYQWQKNGVDIQGATSATYYVANTSLEDAGEYQCLVSNNGGTVKSALVKVVINFNIPVILTQPKSQELIEGNTLNLSVTASGSNLSYLWKKNNNIINGATTNSYTKENISKEDAGKYTCTVSNQAGNIISAEAVITVKNAAPSITKNPQSQDLTPGSTLNLSIEAIGSDLSYQWKKDNTPIEGAIKSSYKKENITSSDEGSYVCIVTNAGGTATSEVAKVKIIIELNIPVFDGLQSEYQKGDAPITLKLKGKESNKFTTFKVNGLTSVQFNPEKAGLYEIEALSADDKSSISTYIIVK